MSDVTASNQQQRSEGTTFNRWRHQVGYFSNNNNNNNDMTIYKAP